MKETNVLLVGFGFSAIPLLRELDRSAVDYTIISESDVLNNLKNTQRYRALYEHYKQVYKEVRGRAPRFSSVEVTQAPTGTTN